jgi:putative FmdB family regulatory protein
MPLYDFECDACGKRFESLSLPYEPVECRHCLAQGARRLVSLPAAKRTETQTGGSMNRELDRREAKRERLTEFMANEGTWGSSQKHD